MFSLFIFFSFPCHLPFSGVQEKSSEFIDISDLEYTSVGRSLRKVFVRSGFANSSIGKYMLGPCPLGTFVDSSRIDPSCKHCPAGKL